MLEELMNISQAAIAKKNEFTEGCQRLVCFDLSIYGHHPHYILCLSKGWAQRLASGTLIFVVSPEFLQVHGDVVNQCCKLSRTIQFIALSDAEQASLLPRTSGLNRNLRNFQEWRLFAAYAEKLQADHSLMLYLDTCLLPMAAGLSFPCSFSGIYFRPTFHYHTFSAHAKTRRDQIQIWREKIILNRVLHHSQFKRLLSLDPFAPDHIFPPKGVLVEPLADPINTSWQTTTVNLKLRHELAIENDRTVFLLFGALTPRKGVYPLLDSLSLLPDSVGQKISLVLLGEANPQDQQRISTIVAKLRQQKQIQILERYEFVEEVELHQYIAMADVVLAPYQKHVGMSGILMQAALHEKPVLSSNYGLMGELVNRYGLGLGVESSSPNAIAQGLEKFVETPEQIKIDRNKMAELVHQNSSVRFSEIALSRI